MALSREPKVTHGGALRQCALALKLKARLLTQVGKKDLVPVARGVVAIMRIAQRPGHLRPRTVSHIQLEFIRFVYGDLSFFQSLSILSGPFSLYSSIVTALLSSIVISFFVIFPHQFLAEYGRDPHGHILHYMYDHITWLKKSINYLD